MNEMKSTQGVMINVASNVNRFIGKDDNLPLIKIYKDTYDEVTSKIEKLARIEELILQQRCMNEDNINIKLSILRDYVYARCPFYRRDKSTKDIRVIVSRIDLVNGNYNPSIKTMYEDENFIAKAKAKLIDAMRDEFLVKSEEYFKLYD